MNSIWNDWNREDCTEVLAGKPLWKDFELTAVYSRTLERAREFGFRKAGCNILMI